MARNLVGDRFEEGVLVLGVDQAVQRTLPSQPGHHDRLLVSDQQYIRLFASHLLIHSFRPGGDRLFDEGLERRQQLRAERAVDHAVVAGQRDRHLADEFDAAVFRFDRRAARGADGEDGGVRRIDDGGELAHAVHAEIGDGARAALVFGGLELLGAGARGEIAHFGRDGGERFCLGVAHHRRDQPAVERHRHADVGMLRSAGCGRRPTPRWRRARAAAPPPRP